MGFAKLGGKVFGDDLTFIAVSVLEMILPLAMSENTLNEAAIEMNDPTERQRAQKQWNGQIRM